MRYVMGLVCGASMLLSSGSAAEAKGMTIGQLKAMVKDLGYAATSDDESTVTLPDQGKWSRNVFLHLHDGGDSLELTTNLGEIPDGDKTVIPYKDLLTTNGDSPFFFAIADSDGKPCVFQEGYLPAALVSKQVLRKTIDGWLVRIDTTEPTWNSDHWAAAAPKAPSEAPPGATPAAPPPAPPLAAVAPPQAPAAQTPAATAPRKIFCDRSVEKDPLKIENVSFRMGPAGEEDGKIARPSSVFGSDEPMYIVVEVTGFLCNSLDKDRYQALFTIDQSIKASGDPDYEPLLSLSKSLEFDTSKEIDRAYIDLTLTPHWKTSGKFSFRYTVQDNVKGSEASTVIPLTIEAPKQTAK